MKVYLILLLFTLSACASSKSVYKASHEHLERNPQYVSVGIWVFSGHWVELIDDINTTFVFDEAFWKFDGVVNYIDIVHSGGISRYGWDFTEQRFNLIELLRLEDGRLMDSFQYFYKLDVNSEAPTSRNKIEAEF